MNKAQLSNLIQQEAELCLQGKTTREISEITGTSKSTVHYHLTTALKNEGKPILYDEVQKMLKKNKREAPHKGGRVTRGRYTVGKPGSLS